MKRIYIVIWCLITPLISSALDKPAQLRVENKTGRVAVEAANPQFGWILNTKKNGYQQAAWQIQVALSEADCRNGKGSTWDSQKVRGDQQNFIRYKGKALQTAVRYFWRVRVWSSAGEASEWSEPATFFTGVLEGSKWDAAKWIGFEELAPSLKVVPGIHLDGDHLGEKGVKRAVIPLFQKSFEAKGKVKQAFLYVSGLGHHETSLNGEKVGDDFLAPGWTNYDQRTLYNAYDVTSQLRSGKNEISAIVGTGFRYINRERYRKMVRAEAFPMIRLILVIRYQDGTTQEINTDQTWKTAPSQITFSSIYGGEDYDATLPINGWKDVVLVSGPVGKMSVQTDYPLQVMETFDSKEKKKLDKNKFLYDFGQNASGIIRLKVKGKKGDHIKITPAEILDDHGLPYQNASGSPYHFNYTLKGGETEIWEPKFTYYGFRYAMVEIISESDWATNTDLTLQLLHTRNSSPTVGSFESSNPLLNQINELINWGIKSNMASVATDCPHREKLGWLEQTHLIGSSLKYNYDIYNLYNKIIDDMIEGQLPNGLVPDIVPEYVPFEGGFRDSPEWGSASIIIPWYLYQWYGDHSVLRKAYPMMKAYLSYLGTKADQNILSHGLGDWFDLGPKDPGVSQLTPIALTATATYYYDADLLAKIANAIGEKEDEANFRQLASEIKTAFNRKFLDAEKGVYATGSQTSYAMPLYMGLVEEKHKRLVADNLIDSIMASDKALTAGDVGYRYLLRALEEKGASQLIYEMNNRDDVPGYGFQIKNGATALTESWPALKFVSNNHMMLGHLMEWLYSGLAGIKQQENDFGFKKIEIEPEMVDGLDWVKASYESINGKVNVHWSKTKKMHSLTVSIPANTVANIVLPISNVKQIKENGRSISANKHMKYAGMKGDKVILEVGSGDYSFTF